MRAVQSSQGGRATRSLPLLGALALGLAAGAGACSLQELDSVSRVHDLRILAVRLDPPEIEVPFAPDAPPVEIVATALIAAPEGDEVVYTTRGCISPSSAACDDGGPADPEDAELYVPLTEPRTASAAVDEVPEARVVFTRELPAPLLMDLMANAGVGALAGARPAFEVTAEAGGVSETAFKRLQVSVPDFAYRLALGEAGIPICDDQGLPEGCLPYATRVPNRNPTFAGLRVVRAPLSEDDPGEPVPLPEEGVLVLAPGEEVRLDPSVGPDDAEPYQTLGLDFETEEIFIEDKVERLGFTWVSTAGSFSRRRTEEDRTLGAGNYFTAPSEVPATGLSAWIWIVLRDTRGGVDFRTVAISVEP